MNVIKKTTAILFIIFLSACSTDSEEFEEQNTLITSELRTQEENSTLEIVIQFREHISEAEREEVRDRLISEEIITDYEIISHEVGIDRWNFICLDPFWDSRRRVYLCLGNGGPLGTLEDDDVIVIISKPGDN